MFALARVSAMKFAMCLLRYHRQRSMSKITDRFSFLAGDKDAALKW